MNQFTKFTKEGAGLKLVLVLSSISPLFALLAIRGSDILPDYYFELICTLLIIVPNLLLLLKLRSVKQNVGPKRRSIGKFDNNTYHVIIYLVALLLPFYRHDIVDERELAATIAALAFVVFVFLRLNLYYLNLYFIILDYKTFTIHASDDTGAHADKTSWILITPRSSLQNGVELNAYRISNTVYWEEK